ncbi:MAG: prolipoprotein diacylglyceryl transferase, partial [Deltaproteobacteria bacterium]|nr:prolipoprotein diacylglyceryl transferase [Deltaproteobacteria bacterium]
MIVYFLELGNFGIPVFGLLIAVSVLGGLVVMRKFLLSSVDVKIAENVAITSVLLGFLGAKIWYEIFVAENFFRDFDIREGISGIVFHGGFITGSLAFVLISKFYRLPLLCMLDAGSLALLFGFGVGRLACQISGDGDYGLPTDSFIGMAYKSGVIPIWEPVYPTPIFESLTALAGF